MRKKILTTLMVLTLMATILVGCKNTADTSNNTTETTPSSNVNNQTEDDGNMPGDNEQTNQGASDEGSLDDLDTVTDDAYEPGVIEVTEDMIEVEEAVVGEAQLDDETLSEIADLVDFAYYNYLWQPSLESEAMTTENMQRFAISYIYQYEYNELFFDTTDFVLYIPEDHVTHIIELFFDATFVAHGIESSLVTYDDGYYLMPAIDGGNLYDPDIVSVVETSDFSYKVTFQSTDPNQSIDDSNTYYELGIEQRDGRYIYTSYQMKIIYPEESADETEATEGN